MKPTRIFLDLDDVCAEFTMFALAEVGCPVKPFEYDKYDLAWGFDIVKAVNALHPTKKFTVEEFWQNLNYSFWLSLPETREFKWLLQTCEFLVGRENICILTAPTFQPYVASAKIQWIQEHCPSWLHRQFLIGPPKHFCAGSGALLIDDSEVNLDAFSDYGGKTLTMPRPWNDLYQWSAKDSQRYLYARLQDIFFQLPAAA